MLGIKKRKQINFIIDTLQENMIYCMVCNKKFHRIDDTQGNSSLITHSKHTVYRRDRYNGNRFLSISSNMLMYVMKYSKQYRIDNNGNHSNHSNHSNPFSGIDMICLCNYCDEAMRVLSKEGNIEHFFSTQKLKVIVGAFRKMGVYRKMEICSYIWDLLWYSLALKVRLWWFS